MGFARLPGFIKTHRVYQGSLKRKPPLEKVLRLFAPVYLYAVSDSSGISLESGLCDPNQQMYWTIVMTLVTLWQGSASENSAIA